MTHKSSILLAVNIILLSYQTVAQSAPAVRQDTAKEGTWTASNVAAFEEKLESLRQRFHIPGLSAGIVEEEGRRLPMLRADGFFRAVKPLVVKIAISSLQLLST